MFTSSRSERLSARANTASFHPAQRQPPIWPLQEKSLASPSSSEAWSNAQAQVWTDLLKVFAHLHRLATRYIPTSAAGGCGYALATIAQISLLLTPAFFRA